MSELKHGTGLTFIAQFRGRCTECDQVIEVGEPISGISGQGYMHVSCPDEPDERPTRFQGATLDEMGF